MNLIFSTIFMNRLTMVLFKLFLLCSWQSLAQTTTLSDKYTFKHWTVDYGLPVNEIVDIAQTNDGYLWLATFDGLVRFDGDHFKIFNTGNTPEFRTNRFIQLLVDARDNLWIITEKVQGHEMLMVYQDGQFSVFDANDGLKGKLNLQLDVDGGILVGSENGAFYHEGNSLKTFLDQLSGKAIRNIAIDSMGGYWFATHDGIYSYKNKNLDHYSEEHGLNSPNTYALLINDNKKVWIATDIGLNMLENDTIYPIETDWPRSANRYIIFHENPQTKDGFYLIHDGHYIYSHQEDEFNPYLNPADQGDFKVDLAVDRHGDVWTQAVRKLFRNGHLMHTFDSPINRIFPDKIGNIWIAHRGGLVQMKPRFIKSYSDKISTVYTLTTDADQTVWATQNHINLFRLEEEKFTKVNAELGIPHPRPSYSIYDSGDGKIWVGTVNGVFEWDKKNKVKLVAPPQQSRNDIDKAIPPMRDVKAIHKDGGQSMWFGGNNGIHLLDKNQEWSYYGIIEGEDILGVRLIYMTRDSTLWFCTNGNGLLYFRNGRLHQVNKNKGLSGDIIRSVYEDDAGILWVGTEGWGLNRLERSADGNTITHISTFDKKNGLFDNVIHQILEDNHNRLWMNSNRGVFWVDRSELAALAKGEITSIYSFFYDEKDGLPGREGNGGVQPAGFKSIDGEMWFPMMGGVARIDPDHVKISPLNVFIEEVETSDSLWYVGKKDQEVLPRGQRDFSIRYSALDFSTSPANIRYRYKLEGFREQWVEADNDKEARFNNLSPGTYEFIVMANNGGGWVGNKTSLKIVLPHYFYETYWFYGLMIFLLTFIIYKAINWRIRLLKKRGKALELQVNLRTQDLIREKEETERQKEKVSQSLATIEKQAAELKELDMAKSRFFTNISHEFRTPLTLIIGPLEDQLQKIREGKSSDEEEMEVAIRNSKRLLRLVNQILDVAKLESGHIQLKAQAVDIRTVLRPIVETFSSLAERKNIELLSIEPDFDVTVYVDIDLIERVIINLISNAFKFSPEGSRVQITIKEQDSDVVISIKDNGPGIPKEEQAHIFERFYQVDEKRRGIQPGTGIGLSLVHELITLHKGTIELISEKDKGAEFLIRLQKGNGHLNEHEVIPSSSIGTYRTQSNKTSEFNDNVSSDHKTQKEAHDEDRPRLLIVEDNAEIRAYVRKHMSPFYVVMEAENGMEGFEKVKDNLPDLVISDVMMPVSDGYELCKKIKQDPELDFIPVVLLTAKAETAMRIEGLDLGADDYITKPFVIDELKARVKNLIRSRKKLKERLANGAFVSKIPDQMGWVDNPFANRVRKVIELNLGNEDFSVTQLADAVQVGRTTLYSRILEITGKTPSEMIKRTRLYQAAQLFQEDAGNISEIAYACGFKSISHFSKTFKAEFQKSPSEFKKIHTK